MVDVLIEFRVLTGVFLSKVKGSFSYIALGLDAAVRGLHLVRDGWAGSRGAGWEALKLAPAFAMSPRPARS
jgi:hypothetical protein